MRGQRGSNVTKYGRIMLKVVIELLGSNEEENQTYMSRFIISQILHPATKLIDLISKLWINKNFQRNICDVLPDTKSATQCKNLVQQHLRVL